MVYNGNTRWLLIAPAVPGSALFPELPSDLQAIDPTISTVRVLAANPLSASGYDAIRADSFVLFVEADGVLTPSTSSQYKQ